MLLQRDFSIGEDAIASPKNKNFPMAFADISTDGLLTHFFLQNQGLLWLVEMADLSNRYLKSVHSFSEKTS